MAKGRGLKGQKWSEEKQAWYYPEGVVPAPPKEKKKKEQMVSLSEVEKLLEKQSREFEAKLAKSANIDPKSMQSIDKTEIPESDLLPEPVYYYAWGRTLGVSGYTLKGRPVLSPYGRPIKLQRLVPDIIFNAQGDREELEKCGIAIWSKREIEFIENSLLFKSGAIRKQLTSLNREDYTTQNVRMQAMAIVSKLTPQELITKCKDRQIKDVEDFGQMQMLLIDSIYKESVGKLKHIQQDVAERSAKEYAKVQ